MSLKQEIETWVFALAHYDNNEYEEALKVFDKISDTSKILFNCGVIHATLGEHAKAVECYQRAVTLDNYFAIAYFQQGVSNFLLGDFEEALANFNDTLLYLRGNTCIDYEQLGLKFRLFSCEVLFNRGLCYIYLRQTPLGISDLEYAAKEKVIPDHDVINEAITEKAEGYTVFSIPVGVIYRPNEAKVKNLKTKDYLGKARLVATSDRSNVYTDLKKIMPPDAIAIDDRLPENISFAATNLVHKNLVSRGRQQSAPPPISRTQLPPTPPPDSEKPSSIKGHRSTASASGMSTEYASSVRSGPPPRLDLNRPGTRTNGRTGELPSMEGRRIGTMRTASEPRGPPSRQYPTARSRDAGKPLYGETTGSRWTPTENAPQSTFYHPDDIFDHYSNSRFVGGGREAAARRIRQQPSIGEERQNSSDAEEDDLIEEGEFEIMPKPVSRSRTRRISHTRTVRKYRIKVHTHDDTRYIMIGSNIDFRDFEGKIRDKFGFRSHLRIRMQDDGDMITMGDQDDLDLLLTYARDIAKRDRQEMGKIEIWVEERV